MNADMVESKERLIFGAAIVLLLLGLQILRQPSSMSRSKEDQVIWNSKITSHLQVTDRRVEHNSLAVELDNHRLAPRVDGADMAQSRSATPDHFAPLSFDREDLAAKVYRDTNAGGPSYDNGVLPGEKVEVSLEHRKWLYEYDREQKEQFIRAFIDNANAQGVELQIDESLQVKARQARQQQKPLRLPLSIEGGNPGAAQ